ncbi:MAG: hypothetical protein QM820_18605 [Minicystis sp.]
MSDFDGRWRERTGRGDRHWGVWAAIGAVVLAVNAVTGGEAITRRIDQATSFADAAVALVRCQVGRLSGCGEARKAAADALDEAEVQKCHRTIRIRRVTGGWAPRVVVRRRWSCRV